MFDSVELFVEETEFFCKNYDFLETRIRDIINIRIMLTRDDEDMSPGCRIIIKKCLDIIILVNSPAVYRLVTNGAKNTSHRVD